MKSLEQKLRDGNYDINDVLNDETSERRVFLARMGRDVEALAGTLESDVLVALIENGYAEDYYDDWCFHASSNVRKALAHKGYYVIQPELKKIAQWIFGIPAERLDEFDYELV